MPEELRRRLDGNWDDRVALYAVADLNEELCFGTTWIVAGFRGLVLISGERINQVPYASLQAVREQTGVSCSVLVLEGGGGRAVARLRYTHRQRRGMADVRFWIERALREGVEGDPKGELREPGKADTLYLKRLLEPIQEAQSGLGAKQKALWRLLGYLRPYRRRLVYGMAGASFVTLASLAPAYFTGRLLDTVIRPYQAGTMGGAEALATAWKVLGLLAGAYALRELFGWVRLSTMSVVGEYVAADLRRDLYAHMQRMGLKFFSSRQTGSLISRVITDTDRIWDFIAMGVVEVSVSLLLLLGLGTVLLSLDWRLGLAMAAPVPLVLFMIWRHGERMQALFLRAWRKWSGVSEVLSDTLPGIRVVKAFSKETHERRRFQARNRDAMTEFNRVHRHWAGFWPLLMLGVHATVLGVWALALPRLLGAAGPALPLGRFVSFVLYMTMFSQPLEVIGQMSRMLNRAASSAHRIFEILDTVPEKTGGPGAIRPQVIRGQVEFESVAFTYDGIRPVLRDVSFAVRPGEMIGLVGPSGGGKSTLVNLIARFHEPNSGRIVIDGIPSHRYDARALRRHVGMVLQDPYLFHGTILDNLRYAKPEATLDQVVEAARAAHAHDFICRLSHGYDTVVGERGHTLSGGERQRVSIARAILHDPRILILDEATSAVDTETERRIQEALDRLVQGRTVFAIAHRLSTLARADRIFAIREGRIVEAGTHGELLARPGGVYRELFELQHGAAVPKGIGQ